MTEHLRISEPDRLEIAELRTRQDHHAFSLGVAEAEYLQRKAALLDVAVGLDRAGLERLGALEWEHHRAQAFWYEKIVEARAAQAAAGEAALRSVGVDPASGEFTVDDEACVLALRAGAWQRVEG